MDEIGASFVVCTIIGFALLIPVRSCGVESAMKSGCHQSCRMESRIADDGRLCVCDDGRVLRRDSAHWYRPMKGGPSE